MLKPDEFDAIYWAAQPKVIRSIRALATEAEREACSTALTRQGIKIDWAVLVMGVSPFAAMTGRAMNGYEWYPAVGERHPGYAPGCALPGIESVPMGPAWGSIRVSVDPRHYPAILDPVEPFMDVSAPSSVGVWLPPLVAYDCRDASLPVGSRATASDGTPVVLAEMSISPFAPNVKVWKKKEKT